MHGHTENHTGGRRQRGREDRFIDISYQYWLPRYLDLLGERVCAPLFSWWPILPGTRVICP